MPQIKFQFSPEKAVQTAAYLLRRLNCRTGKIKLMKLMYYADRDHFLEFGRPITGDEQWALPNGPVPSQSLDLLNGGSPSDSDLVFAHLSAGNKHFELHDDPGESMLSDSDRTVLDAVLKEHGNKHTSRLWTETHALPEYQEVQIENSSARIPYELMLKHYSQGRGFRQGRAVITSQIAAHMNCPFPESEPDL